MARKPYEGSAADEREDARGAKALGISRQAYEKTGRDKREDKAGEDRVPITSHSRARPQRRPKAPPAPPQPGQTDFDADQEKAMRAGRRAANIAAPAPMPGDDAEVDTDFGGI